MKEIKAVIGPQRLPGLHEALRAVAGFPGMTVSRAEGYVAPSPHVKHSIREELTDHVTRVRIEMLVPDELADLLFDTVVNTVSAGSPGDSLVWMTEVGRAAFVHKTV
ncbi:MAG: P-II family nitrogen regulator [Burkholderiales bacterium]